MTYYVVGDKDNNEFLAYDPSSGGYPYLAPCNTCKMFRGENEAKEALEDLNRHSYISSDNMKVYQVSLLETK